VRTGVLGYAGSNQGAGRTGLCKQRGRLWGDGSGDCQGGGWTICRKMTSRFGHNPTMSTAIVAQLFMHLQHMLTLFNCGIPHDHCSCIPCRSAQGCFQPVRSAIVDTKSAFRGIPERSDSWKIQVHLLPPEVHLLPPDIQGLYCIHTSLVVAVQGVGCRRPSIQYAVHIQYRGKDP
jgi:hypothetical protein